MGMVGGGKDAFIGAVHRRAALMDGRAELVCGAFSRSPEKSQAAGRECFLPDHRIYGSFQEMFAAERRLPAGERMDFVVIVTPNDVHYPAAMAALAEGFHVVCDKPMTTTLAEARRLELEVRKTGRLFCLTHNYTGYPMVKEARDLARDSRLGKIRRVVVEYPQGWLAARLEATGQKQAAWRTDPKHAGATCCMGDIGSHCENLAEYITGLKIKSLCADLTTFVKGRTLDDDGSVLLRFDNGARGVLWASQIAVGEENALAIRVYGEKGAVIWRQQDPDTLIIHWTDRANEIRRRGTGFVGPAAAAATRLPAGHPEGFHDAFANLYRRFYDALEATAEGRKIKERDYPDVHDGVRGMAFLEAVVRSSRSGQKWINL
ncbi:MAG: Gfo/Idh/MocA family oxidoreductase [Verrucomicrobia bacterium]|nr:Gfo/Idh/MocA family oxidoreductase [Verrucomicrobiota bacterium]MBU1734524.1 Gfo/Idh/MocA family oxidoreductase [Verrucomicrobiota bacterium]MBU1857883.1 Gfo/Idh/MocA family oxidoreductase [Verrucomicrobiota bacterium]